MKHHMASNFRDSVRPRRLADIAVLVAMMTAPGRVAVAQAPINKMCPVMTLEEVDPAVTTRYRGKTIAFCCDICLKKFLTNPAQYEGQLEAFANEGANQAEHDHDSNGGASKDAHHHDSDETAMPLLARIHPVVVHFPLAGVPIAMVAFFGWLVSRKKLFPLGDVPPMLLAAAFSIVGVITGNMAHDSMRFSTALHNYVQWHQYAATTLMVLLLSLSSLRLWRWRRLEGKWLIAYAIGLAVACGLVGVVGYLGGSLVFGPDHLWP